MLLARGAVRGVGAPRGARVALRRLAAAVSTSRRTPVSRAAPLGRRGAVAMAGVFKDVPQAPPDPILVRAFARAARCGAALDLGL
jgi:hypothetical protein